LDTPPAKRIYYGYWLIVAAFIAQFVSVGVYSYVLGSFMTPMVDELGWTRADFTLTRSIGQLVMAFVGVLVGSRVDRFGGRPIMLIGNTILVSALLAHSYINTLWEWLFLNGVVMTVGCAMIGNLVVNVTLSKWFVINRGKAVAWAAMGVSFGGIVLTPLATWLIDTQGWREAWLWLGLFAGVFLYPVAVTIRRAPEDYGLNPDGLSAEEMSSGAGDLAQEEDLNAYTRGQALRTATFYGLVIAFGFFTINIIVLILQTIPYLTDNGFTRIDGVTAMIAASIPAMLSKPVWGYLVDKMRVKPLASVSASVTGLALFLIVGAVSTRQLPLIYVAYVMLGLGWGGMIPMQEVIWARFFGRKHLGAIRGAGMPFSLLLGAVAPWAVSYYHDVVGEYDGALLIVAGLNVMSGLLIFLVPPPRRSH